MRRAPRSGFRRQLTLTVTAAIVCLALVSSLMNTLAASWRVKGQLVDAGRQVTESFARQSTLALLTRAPGNAALAVSASLAFPDVLQVEIFDAAGRLLLRRAARNAADPASGATASGTATGVVEFPSAWVFTAPVLGGAVEDSPFEPGAHAAQVLGHVRVVLGKGSLDRLLVFLLVGNLLITFAVAAVLLAILGRLTRRMVTPLADLSALMHRAEAGETGMRALPSGPSDIHDMAHAFNQMMHVLEEREGLLTQSRDEAVRVAYVDSLTGLPNRIKFLEQLTDQIQQAGQTNKTVTILFLDLNRFKNVNDTLGHHIGDRLLIAVGHQLRSSVRRGDYVARLGGDEFIVALSNASTAAATATAKNISHTLSSPFHIDGNDLFISASIGVSVFPRDGADASTLLKHADLAMYTAKRSGSDIEFFEDAMEQSLRDHVRLESELRLALDRGEIEVFYQPKALVDGSTVVGMEALVRWRHPTRGLMVPNEFIPLSEETGLILPLGELVLRTACGQVQAWAGQGLPALPVAVNISGRQLQQVDIVQRVERALQETGLPPHLLELEVTESTLMEDAQATLVVLRQLRELGVRLSIDDFGTGYSSLVYLKRFPMNTLKIDYAFVRDLPGDADDVVIVNAIIALAHSLRLEVVAEGVETPEQRAFLEQSSCDLIQGYLLSTPVPADEFAARFLAKSPLKPP